MKCTGWILKARMMGGFSPRHSYDKKSLSLRVVAKARSFRIA